MKKYILVATYSAAVVLAGCSTQQIAQANKYQADVAAACAIASETAQSPLAVAAMANVPEVAQAAALVRASCGTEQAIASLVLSPTSVAWLGTLQTTLKTGGKVILPPPVAP